MKLRRSDEARTVYLDPDGDEIDRGTMLDMLRGKSLSESKTILARYQKAKARVWLSRDRKPMAQSYSDVVSAIEIKPADAEERRSQLLKAMREALEKASAPDASLEDLLKSQRLQLEYQEFIALLDD